MTPNRTPAVPAGSMLRKSIAIALLHALNSEGGTLKEKALESLITFGLPTALNFLRCSFALGDPSELQQLPRPSFAAWHHRRLANLLSAPPFSFYLPAAVSAGSRMIPLESCSLYLLVRWIRLQQSRRNCRSLPHIDRVLCGRLRRVARDGPVVPPLVPGHHPTVSTALQRKRLGTSGQGSPLRPCTLRL